jgi:hypothetical protein
MRGRPMIKYSYQEVDVEVMIDVDDVIGYINDYASISELEQIRPHLTIDEPFPTKTLVDTMKVDLLRKAVEKYTLDELEGLLKLQYI